MSRFSSAFRRSLSANIPHVARPNNTNPGDFGPNPGDVMIDDHVLILTPHESSLELDLSLHASGSTTFIPSSIPSLEDETDEDEEGSNANGIVIVPSRPSSDPSLNDPPLDDLWEDSTAPQTLYSSSSSAPYECPICFDVMVLPMTMNCGGSHTYCSSCIRTWSTVHRKEIRSYWAQFIDLLPGVVEAFPCPECRGHVTSTTDNKILDCDILSHVRSGFVSTLDFEGYHERRRDALVEQEVEQEIVMHKRVDTALITAGVGLIGAVAYSVLKNNRSNNQRRDSRN